MPKFRKRHIIVEAEQWFFGKKVKGVQLAVKDGSPRSYVTTIHNQLAYLDDGDWVITEPDGIHHYPCKPDIFHKTYEPVEESEQ